MLTLRRLLGQASVLQAAWAAYGYFVMLWIELYPLPNSTTIEPDGMRSAIWVA